MKKILILTLIFMCNCAIVKALEIVYPKQNPVTINSESTFFIGSTKPTDTLTINGTAVQVHANGAFSQVVPLVEGENHFKIISAPKILPIIRDEAVTSEMFDNEPENIDFVINRPQKTAETIKLSPLLVEYDTPKNFSVIKEGAPLRTIPVDWGITRLSHLPVGMKILINGEKGDFYRVSLGDNVFGWIMKSDVEELQDCTQNLQTATVSGFKKWSDNEFNYYEFYLDRKSPYAIKEENGLKLRLYNVVLGENAGAFIVCDKVLTYNFPYQKKIQGYDTYFDGENLVIKIRKQIIPNLQQPLLNVKVMIDAGHGGAEAGAVGPLGGKEKDINLEISKYLERELFARGADVSLTRKDDSAVSLPDRVKLSKEKNVTLFVSVHANALPDSGDPSKATGCATYYYYNQAKPLANSILTSMSMELGLKNNNSNQASFAVVRNTSAVSVLIEVAYIINPEDYAKLTDSAFQRKAAHAIADGIEKYMSGEIINLR